MKFKDDEDQDEVCSSTARHLLVVAPPGTGKTFLTIRLAGQLAANLPSGSAALVLTFSNQARVQLEREAVRQLAPEIRKVVEIRNYHSFFWRAVRANRRALGIPQNFDIGSRQRREKAVERVVGPSVMRMLAAHEGLLDALAEHRYPEFRDERTPDLDLLEQLLDITRKEQLAGRLVFDDLGALCWELLNRFPILESAYRRRFPIVIADEHQDASSLQDAMVRRLAVERLVIFADPWQLIHEYRGARTDRLNRHFADCDERLSLRTSHRWAGREGLGRWLHAVRKRLEGHAYACPRPTAVLLVRVQRLRGMNAVKTEVRRSVGSAFRRNLRTVAVLARTNDEVVTLQNYLCRQKMYPRQISSVDFEEARSDIEKLSSLDAPELVSACILERVKCLVPQLSGAVEKARIRLKPGGVDMGRAGKEARLVLEPLGLIYQEGPARYFKVLADILSRARDVGLSIPQTEAALALHRTAARLAGSSCDIFESLSVYSHEVMIASQIAPRTRRGLYVMTAHQAKGKEFDHVVLSSLSKQYYSDTLENRRLLYVAVTRASASLTVIFPDEDASPLLETLMTD